MLASQSSGDYHFSDTLHTSSSYPKFLELVDKYCGHFSEAKDNPTLAVDLGSGDCQRVSEYLQFADIIQPIELDQTSCRQAGPHLRELVKAGKTVLSLDESGDLQPQNCSDLGTLVDANSVDVVTSRGGPEQGILEQIWSVLKDGGIYIKSGHIPAMEALEALRDVRPSGFERQVRYAEKRAQGMSSYTTHIEAAGFEVLDAAITHDVQEFDETRMLKMLMIPAVFGPQFDPSKNSELFRKFRAMTQGDEHPAGVYRTKSQDVLVVAQKIVKERADA